MTKEFWYNQRTGEVEEGKQSGSLDRVGPFPSREEAENAPETLRRRAEAWREDDESESEWPDDRS